MHKWFFVRFGGVFRLLAGPLAKLRFLLVSVLQTTPTLFLLKMGSCGRQGTLFSALLVGKSHWTKNTPAIIVSSRRDRSLQCCSGQLKHIQTWLHVHFGGVFDLVAALLARLSFIFVSVLQTTPTPLWSKWDPAAARGALFLALLFEKLIGPKILQ